MVDYTYQGYEELIRLVSSAGYEITGFSDYESVKRPCILRHDVDLSPEAALKIAEMESAMGIRSTYFVLVNTGFYNIFHSETNRMLKKLVALNHTIGLHFDAKQYEDISDRDSLCAHVLAETDILANAVESNITSFSIHRPTQTLLETQLEIDGMVNSYSETFFKKFKYISDSRMRWREPPDSTITCGQHSRLQILTHPIWYGDKARSIQEVLLQYMAGSGVKTHDWLADNITDLESILNP